MFVTDIYRYVSGFKARLFIINEVQYLQSEGFFFK